MKNDPKLYPKKANSTVHLSYIKLCKESFFRLLLWKGDPQRIMSYLLKRLVWFTAILQDLYTEMLITRGLDTKKNIYFNTPFCYCCALVIPFLVVFGHTFPSEHIPPEVALTGNTCCWSISGSPGFQFCRNVSLRHGLCWFAWIAVTNRVLDHLQEMNQHQLCQLRGDNSDLGLNLWKNSSQGTSQSPRDQLRLYHLNLEYFGKDGRCFLCFLALGKRRFARSVATSNSCKMNMYPIVLKSTAQ